MAAFLLLHNSYQTFKIEIVQSHKRLAAWQGRLSINGLIRQACKSPKMTLAFLIQEHTNINNSNTRIKLNHAMAIHVHRPRVVNHLVIIQDNCPLQDWCASTRIQYLLQLHKTLNANQSMQIIHVPLTIHMVRRRQHSVLVISGLTTFFAF